MRFLRGVGKFIDWLGLRLIMLLAVGLVAYVVVQPLIWSQLLHRKPPAATADLSSLMALVVTIMSLALAAFGVLAYQLAERRIEARLDQQAKELQESLRGGAANANAKLFVNISVQAFLSYEDLWRSKVKDPASFLKEPELQAYLESAIENAKHAVEQYRTLPASLRNKPEYAQGILSCKGNYAYFLATRAHQDDRKLVIDIAEELDRQPRINLHKQDTVAWAYLRYSKPGDSLWSTGVSKLAVLMKRADLPPEDAATLRVRYKGTFGPDPGLLTALG